MTEDVDKPPTKDEGDEEEQEEELPVQELKFYLKPENTFKIISTRWGLFTFLAGVVYIYHLIITIAGVNAYCDYSRNKSCNGQDIGENSSAVLDLYVGLVTIFHMIEWARWTVFLTSALVNVDLVKVYYALSVNIIFGFFAMIIALFGFLGAGDCVNKQPSRTNYLLFQALCLVLSFPLCMAHVLLFKIKGVDWCHEQFLADPDEEDEDEEGGGCLAMCFGKKEEEEEEGSGKVAQEQ